MPRSVPHQAIPTFVKMVSQASRARRHFPKALHQRRRWTLVSLTRRGRVQVPAKKCGVWRSAQEGAEGLVVGGGVLVPCLDVSGAGNHVQVIQLRVVAPQGAAGAEGNARGIVTPHSPIMRISGPWTGARFTLALGVLRVARGRERVPPEVPSGAFLLHMAIKTLGSFSSMKPELPAARADALRDSRRVDDQGRRAQPQCQSGPEQTGVQSSSVK